MLKVFPEIVDDPDTIKTLRSIIRYSYEFELISECPYTDVSDCKNDDYIAARRIVVVPVHEIVERITELVREKEKSGCSDLEFPGTTLIAVQVNRLLFGGGIDADQFWCDEIWGKHKVGEANGWWSLAMPVAARQPDIIRLDRPEDPVKDLGDFRFNDPIPGYDISDRTLFGFIDIDGVFGNILNNVFIEFKLSPINIVLTWFGESTPLENMENWSRRIASVYRITPLLQSSFGKPTEDYLEVVGALDPLDVFPFYVDDVRTGFYAYRIYDSRLHVDVVQVAYIPREVVELNYKFGFAQDIEFIKDWSEGEPAPYIVVDGDSLWRIAENKFGNGRMMSLIASYNDIDPPHAIFPRQKILIPRIWEIVDLHRSGRILEEGDSLWSVYLESSPESSWSEWLASRNLDNPDMVFPGQIVNYK